MNKKYLLPDTKQYKANLHCHTILSDGNLTPEQVKDAYKSHGYSVVAFTDHEYIVNHQDLNDADFIAVTGYEVSAAVEPADWHHCKCVHLNLYAKNPFEDRHVCFSPENVNNYKLALPIKHSLKYVGKTFAKTYNDMQYIIDEANSNGFLVCLNHPYWSLQRHSDYFNLHGIFAMEVYNSGCNVVSGNSWYDYGLLADSRSDVAPIAADDNHNPDGNIENSDSFGGYTMLCTDDFSYSGILTAMEQQNFYASTGIDINELYVQDGKVHLSFTECTDAVVYFSGRIWHKSSSKSGLTSVCCEIKDGARYIRVLLHDSRNGHNAATKAYYL